jgi:hypothetical protein
MIRTPYLIADVATAATTTSTVLTAAANSSPGDVLVVGVGGPGSSPVAASSVTDTENNTYVQACAVAPSGSLLPASLWFSVPPTVPLISGTDTLTVNYNSATSRAKTIHWAGVSGASAVDQTGTSTGSGTAVSVSTSTLDYEPEVAFFLVVDGFAGAAPTGFGSFTNFGTVQNGATQWQALAWQIVNSTTAVSGSATITSATWTALMATVTGSSPAGLLVSNGPARRRASTW